VIVFETYVIEKDRKILYILVEGVCEDHGNEMKKSLHSRILREYGLLFS